VQWLVALQAIGVVTRKAMVSLVLSLVLLLGTSSKTSSREANMAAKESGSQGKVVVKENMICKIGVLVFCILAGGHLHQRHARYDHSG